MQIPKSLSKLAIIFLLGSAVFVFDAYWSIPVRTEVSPDLSDSATVAIFFQKMGYEEFDFSRFVKIDTIDNRRRITRIFLDGRNLPARKRDRTFIESFQRSEEIFTGLSNLSELRYLRIRNIHLYQMPPEIAELHKLEEKEFTNTGIENPPISLRIFNAAKRLLPQ